MKGCGTRETLTAFHSPTKVTWQATLFPIGAKGYAAGKVILIGEHAVLYGAKALATVVPNCTLQITAHEPCTSWTEAWEFPQGLAQSYYEQLIQILKHITEWEQKDFRSITPQKIKVSGSLPLCAGMGGSAALSVALLRMARQHLHAQFFVRAKALDNIFHGRASGIDVATICAHNLIKFSIEDGWHLLSYTKPLIVAVIDSQERSSTKQMVENVRTLLQSSVEARKAMDALKELSTHVANTFPHMDVKEFGLHANTAQALLRSLNLSTPTLNKICEKLLACGAYGAKLTGSGGGGLVLGFFDSLDAVYELEKHFSVIACFALNALSPV